MTPYTRLVSSKHDWYLLCTIYRRTANGNRMVYVMSRDIPMCAFTEDNGIKLEEIDKVVQRPLSKKNCSFVHKYELIGNRSTGYRLKDSSRNYFPRIQDGLEQLLGKYCVRHNLKVVKEYH